MTAIRFYTYVQFYCVHTFRGADQMLMYSGYRRTDESNWWRIKDIITMVFKTLLSFVTYARKYRVLETRFTLWMSLG